MFKYKASVVLSSYNAGERLQLTLPAYNYQTMSKDAFEVILVDDGSTDGTLEILSQLQLNFPHKIITLASNEGRASARNHGIKASSGEIIIFSDGDMLPEKEFIYKHITHHNKTNKTFLCGSFWNKIYTYRFDGLTNREFRKLKRIQKNYPSFLDAKRDEKLSILYEQNQLNNYSSPQNFSRFYESLVKEIGANLRTFKFSWLYFIVMNVSVEKRLLDKAGYFDENFKGWGGEDEELGYRLYKMGLRGVVDVHLKNFHQEHPRMKQKEKIESFNNKLYLLKKHHNLDIFLFYTPMNISLIKRSEALQEYSILRKKEIISSSFHEELIQLLFKTYKKERTNPSVNFTLEWQRLKRSTNYASLVQVIEQLLLRQGKLNN